MLIDQYFLFSFICSLHYDNAAVLELLKENKVSPDELTQMLIRHELAGYCYAGISGTELVDWFRAENIEKLSVVYNKQVKRNEKLLALITEVHDKLAEAEVPFLLIKGFYLSNRYAGGMNRRLMWDQDILVSPADMDETVSMATSIGLQDRSRWPLDPRRLFWRLHAVELSYKSRKLDIHCAFRNLPGMNLDYEAIWNESQSFELSNRQFRTISDEHTLLLLALGLASDIQTSKIKLRKIWDLYLVLAAQDSEIVWDQFFTRRHKEGTLKAVANVLSLCLQVSGTRSECLQVKNSLKNYEEYLLINDRETATKVMQRPYKNLSNRMLFARIQSASVARFWTWWLVTLPVRYLHYSKA